jgi:hypothetical protein
MVSQVLGQAGSRNKHADEVCELFGLIGWMMHLRGDLE